MCFTRHRRIWKNLSHEILKIVAFYENQFAATSLMMLAAMQWLKNEYYISTCFQNCRLYCAKIFFQNGSSTVQVRN